ncbi:hypothetical protein [uncultured Aggregatibacter sp.]|uniref:hypothetical protein n=2 Tax=Aggregatibacter TaxID=416916 RepID=UPI0025F26983|nr:hypothetical protein [uncultured Aggregatibacter sp.]
MAKFLPKITQFPAESERLFASPKLSEKAMYGVVYIILPPMPHNDQMLFELLTALPFSFLAISTLFGYNPPVKFNDFLNEKTD